MSTSSKLYQQLAIINTCPKNKKDLKYKFNKQKKFISGKILNKSQRNNSCPVGKIAKRSV